MRKKKRSRKSLYDEIIEALEDQLECSKTNKHYEEGVFKNARGAVHHALSNAVGYIKAIKELRMHSKKKR